MIVNFLILALLLLLVSYPIVGLLVIILFSFSLSSKLSSYVLFISISLFIAILASLMDLNGIYEGDVQKYYYYYSEFGWQSALVKLKFYRSFMYYIMGFLNLKPGFYTLVTIFSTYFTFFISTIMLAEIFKVDIGKTKVKLVTILLVLSCIKISVFVSYENVFAFTLFLLGIVLFIKKENKYGYFIFFFSCLVHISVVIPMLIFLLYKKYFLKNSYLKSMLLGVIVGSGVLFFSIFQVQTQIYFIDSELNKLFLYFNGPWSIYTPIEKIVYLPFVFLIVIFTFYFCFEFIKSINRVKVSDSSIALLLFLISYATFCAFIISNRTLSVRYILLSPIFISPIVYYFSLKGRVFLKYISTAFLLLILFSPYNIRSIYGYSLLMNMGNCNFPIMSIIEISKFRINYPKIFKANDRSDWN